MAGTIWFHRGVGTMIRGICPECSGPVEGSLHISESHEAGPETVFPCGGEVLCLVLGDELEVIDVTREKRERREVWATA